MDLTIKTIATYALNGSTVEFTIPFEYLARSFNRLALVGSSGRRDLVVGTDYRYVNATTVRLNNPWGTANGYNRLEIRRFTSAQQRIVDFADGSILRASDLNTSQLQAIHIAEEARDAALLTIYIDDEGRLDANGRRIINVADGTLDSDAATVGQYKLDLSNEISKVIRTNYAMPAMSGDPADFAGKVLTFDSSGYPVVRASSAGTPEELALALARADGAKLVGTTQGGTVDEFISGYDSVATLRGFNPTIHGQRVYLRGLNSGSTAGRGYFTYDSMDTTSVDNGWFIVVTSEGKRLKRESIEHAIHLAWAGLGEDDDSAPYIQQAIDYIHAGIVLKGRTFGSPMITIQGVLTHGAAVRMYPYIRIVALGNVYIKVPITCLRSNMLAMYLVDASADPTNYYAGRGAQFPVMFSAVNGGKVRVAHMAPNDLPATGGVLVEDRPAIFRFTSSKQATHNNNMCIRDIECEAMYTTLDIVAVNFWGVRVENCVLSGHIGVNFGSGGSNSGERVSIVNSWIGGRLAAVYANSTNIQLNLDSCSADFLGAKRDGVYFQAGDFFRKDTNGWFALTCNDCHIENFGGYLVNSVGGSNSFVTFRSTTVLPDGTNRSPSPSRKLFKGSADVHLTDTFIQFNQVPYDELDGLIEPGSTFSFRVTNMRSFDNRDMYYDDSAVLSRINKFAGETVGPVSATSAIGFSISSSARADVAIEDTPKALVNNNLTTATIRTLKVTAAADAVVANPGFVFVKGNEFIPVIAGNWYASKVVAASNKMTDISCSIQLRMEWFDDAKVSLGVTQGWYDTFAALAGGAAVGQPTYPNRPNKQIGHIYSARLAPAGARYCKMYYSLTGLLTGQIMYITQHLVYRSPKGS